MPLFPPSQDAVELASEDGDDDLCSVCIGRTFLRAAEEAGMLAAFRSYCTRQVSVGYFLVIFGRNLRVVFQGAASALLAQLEKEKELLRIFLRVSQV